MRIFLTGVSCVGKTTIGRKLAELGSQRFFDLDEEIEAFFGVSVERLHDRFLTNYSYRKEAAKALIHLLARSESLNSVIALPPSGLMAGYVRTIKKTGAIVIAITDRPENILERIVFFDIDSKPIHKTLTPAEKRLYLKEIKKDVTYFSKSYRSAHMKADIAGLDVVSAARKLMNEVELFSHEAQTQRTES